MPRYSANLSILFQELPFRDRFAAARAAGFDGVECWFPYDHSANEIDRIRWTGWVGAEYRPSTTTDASFGWLVRG